MWLVFEPPAGKETSERRVWQRYVCFGTFFKKKSARGLWNKTGKDVLAETANITRAGSWMGVPCQFWVTLVGTVYMAWLVVSCLMSPHSVSTQLVPSDSNRLGSVKGWKRKKDWNQFRISWILGLCVLFFYANAVLPGVMRCERSFWIFIHARNAECNLYL